MSDGEFHAYIALLVLSGLLLSVIAIRGFGTSMSSRVMDGIASVGFLGYAVYLVAVDPAEFWIFYYAFAAPIWAVIHVWRARKAARAARFASYAAAPAGFTPMGAQPQPQHHAAAGAGYGFDGAYPAHAAPSAVGYPYAPPGQPAEAPVAPYSSYQDLPSGLTNVPGPAAPSTSQLGFSGAAQSAYPEPAAWPVRSPQAGEHGAQPSYGV